MEERFNTDEHRWAQMNTDAAERPLAMILQRLDDRHGGQPLVHEQRQGGHVEAVPLDLAGPVEERLHALQRRHRILQAADAQQRRAVGAGRFTRARIFVRRRQGSGVLDAAQQEGGGLARRVAVPVQRGGEA